MKIHETFEVDSTPQEVWEFIADPRKMGSCLPSVQSVDVIDEQHYRSVVKQKVGFISATFEINTEVLEKVAPERMVMANLGKTIFGAAGTLRSHDIITLRPVSGDRTEVTVESDLKMGGQLAILGAKLIESKSRELFAEATANLKRKLAAERSSSESGV